MSTPTAAQKAWHQWLFDYGCCVGGGMGGPLALHHIKGREMKLKGLKNPGHWYCLCMSYWWHQDGRNPAARHVNKKQFEREAGKTEKEMFIERVELYERIYGRKPMGEQVYQQIVERA